MPARIGPRTPVRFPARILGLGDNTVDSYIDLGRQFPGGNAVNVAVLARRMGAETAYLGCLGDDEAGDLLRSALVAEDVDINCCRAIAAANARAFIRHNDGDRQFVRSFPGCRAEWGGFTLVDLSYIAGFDLVHSSIYSGLEPFRDVLRPHIRRWSFDFSDKWTPENLAAWSPFCDGIFLSYANGNDIDCAELARNCAARGAQFVAITRGARGALVLRAGEEATVRPTPVQVVDTLGAGDAFIAACLIGILRDAALTEMLNGASQAAAQACGRFGAFGHGRPWRELDEEAARKVS